MPETVLIDTATRCVAGVTTDPVNPATLPATMSAVVIAGHYDPVLITNRRVKLDAQNNPVQASDAEWAAADFDGTAAAAAKAVRKQAALAALNAAATTPNAANLQAVFRALVSHLQDR